MKFQVLDIIPHLKNPVTGEIVSTADRLNQVVETARRAEELGFTDVVSHWPRSSSPYEGREAVLEQVASEVLPELR